MTSSLLLLTEKHIEVRINIFIHFIVTYPDIRDMIKQNESKVSDDMLLVSDYFYTSDLWQ